MKKLVLVCTVFAAGLITVAQNNAKKITEGQITYEDVMKLDIQLDGPAHMANLLPKERRSNKVLYFNEKAALYENGKKKEEVQNMDMEEGAVMIKMMVPDNKLFTDLANNKRIEQREFMTRMFLINKEIDPDKWKITGNQKVILDYPCQEATMVEDDEKIVVWFTPNIPVQSGPSKFSGLPGMVLGVDINDGERTITATEILDKKMDEIAFEKPKKGKKVSQEKFDEIVEAKMKEADMESSGGHQVMIKIETE